MSDPLNLIAEELHDIEAWLVGGAVRDSLLGRKITDYDVAIKGDAKLAARKIAKAVGGMYFQLSDRFGGWRAITPDRAWHVDFVPLYQDDLRSDLDRRDFTINAMALRLTGKGHPYKSHQGEGHQDQTLDKRLDESQGKTLDESQDQSLYEYRDLIDPHCGQWDLAAATIRMVSKESLIDDPLRALRAIRLATQFGFAIDELTGEAIARDPFALQRTANERIFSELKQIIGCDNAAHGIQLLIKYGAADSFFPEINELVGLEQNVYHHLDAFHHTLAVLEGAVEIEANPSQFGLGSFEDQIKNELSKPLADELRRGEGLRFAALFHDLAKPSTRGITESGRIIFPKHDEVGAQLSTSILKRWAASQRLCEYVIKLVRNHLRVGFMVGEDPLDRSNIWRFLVDTDPYTLDVILLTVADRFATKGMSSSKAIAAHVDVANTLVYEYFTFISLKDKPPLIRGNELAAEIDISPGPMLGEILNRLAQERFLGTVQTRSDAIDRAQQIKLELEAWRGNR